MDQEKQDSGRVLHVFNNILPQQSKAPDLPPEVPSRRWMYWQMTVAVAKKVVRAPFSIHRSFDVVLPPQSGPPKLLQPKLQRHSNRRNSPGLRFAVSARVHCRQRDRSRLAIFARPPFPFPNPLNHR